MTIFEKNVLHEKMSFFLNFGPGWGPYGTIWAHKNPKRYDFVKNFINLNGKNHKIVI